MPAATSVVGGAVGRVRGGRLAERSADVAETVAGEEPGEPERAEHPDGDLLGSARHPVPASAASGQRRSSHEQTIIRAGAGHIVSIG